MASAAPPPGGGKAGGKGRKGGSGKKVAKVKAPGRDSDPSTWEEDQFEDWKARVYSIALRIPPGRR